MMHNLSCNAILFLLDASDTKSALELMGRKFPMMMQVGKWIQFVSIFSTRISMLKHVNLPSRPKREQKTPVMMVQGGMENLSTNIQ
jgi:hypothetical protein